MGFTKHPKQRADARARYETETVSITKTGQVCFSAVAREKYGLSRFYSVDLYDDPTGKRLGFAFHSNRTKSSYRITHKKGRRGADACYVGTKRFVEKSCVKGKRLGLPVKESREIDDCDLFLTADVAERAEWSRA